MIRRHVGSEPVFYYSEELGRSPLSDFYDAIDRVVGDWDALARPLSAVFNRTSGRPTDHVLYLKMFLVGYFQNVVYDTRLAAICSDSMSIRRFLGLTLVDDVPDHSSISRVRDAFAETGGLAQVLEQIVALCVRAGLVGGRSVHVDTTLVRANASLKEMCSLDSGQCVEEHLKEARQNGGKQTVTNAEFYSPGDPEARLRKKRSDKPVLCYMGAHVTDSKSQVILSARMDYGDSSEVSATLPAVAQASQSLALLGESMDVVVGDKAFDSVEFHRKVEEMGLRPATFVHRESQAPGRLSHSDFEFDAQRNLYICPMGKELTYRGPKGERLGYVSRQSDCKHCPLREQCLGPKARRKEISRTPGEEARERNRAFVATAEGKGHLQARASTVEPPFGHMKRYGGLERVNCHGLAKAGVKWLAGAIAWNLLKLIKADSAFHDGTRRELHWPPDLQNRQTEHVRHSESHRQKSNPGILAAAKRLSTVFQNWIQGKPLFQRLAATEGRRHT
jgi:transposase